MGRIFLPLEDDFGGVNGEVEQSNVSSSSFAALTGSPPSKGTSGELKLGPTHSIAAQFVEEDQIEVPLQSVRRRLDFSVLADASLSTSCAPR